MLILKYQIFLLILVMGMGQQSKFKLDHASHHLKSQNNSQFVNQPQNQDENFSLLKTYSKYLLAIIGAVVSLYSAAKISQKLKCCGSSCNCIDNICCNCCCCFNNRCSCCNQY